MPHSLAHWWVDPLVLSLRAGHRANAPVNPLLDGPVTGSWLSGPDCLASGSWPAGPPARLVTGSRPASADVPPKACASVPVNFPDFPGRSLVGWEFRDSYGWDGLGTLPPLPSGGTSGRRHF